MSMYGGPSTRQVAQERQLQAHFGTWLWEQSGIDMSLSLMYELFGEQYRKSVVRR